MELVAIKEGIEVFSDRKRLSAEGDTVSFADGSACDFRKMLVESVGPGKTEFILAPKKDADDDDSEEIKLSFGPGMFSITGVPGKLSIEPHDEDRILVSVSGPRNALQGMRVGELIKAGKNGEENQRVVYVNSLSRAESEQVKKESSAEFDVFGTLFDIGFAILSGGLSLLGGDVSEDIEINVSVPVGTSVNVHGIDGAIDIGNTKGDLKLIANHASEVSVGKVKSALVVSFDVDIEIQKIEGSGTFELKNNGCVTVNDGACKNLSVHVFSSGGFAYHGKAENASVNMEGDGDVYIETISGKYTRQKTGSGEIEIGNS